MNILQKSSSILDLFLSDVDELSLKEISRLSGINKSTARRIILSLIECRFLKQNKKRGKYSLGMKFLDFTQTVKNHNPIMDIAEPFMIQLGKNTNETVSLALWDGRSAVICLSIHPSHPLSVISNEGTILDLHQTSLGKALLSELSDEYLTKYYSRKLSCYTPNTITDPEVLKKNIRVMKREGVAIDDEEGFLGIRGIASVLKNNGGYIVGAITILGPTIRLTPEKMKVYIPMVKECAKKISKDLGYMGN